MLIRPGIAALAVAILVLHPANEAHACSCAHYDDVEHIRSVARGERDGFALVLLDVEDESRCTDELCVQDVRVIAQCGRPEQAAAAATLESVVGDCAPGPVAGGRRAVIAHVERSETGATTYAVGPCATIATAAEFDAWCDDPPITPAHGGCASCRASGYASGSAAGAGFFLLLSALAARRRPRWVGLLRSSTRA